MPIKKPLIKKRKKLTITTLAVEIQEEYPEIAKDYEDFSLSKLSYYYDIRKQYEVNHMSDRSIEKAIGVAIFGSKYISGLIKNEHKINELKLKHQTSPHKNQGIIGANRPRFPWHKKISNLDIHKPISPIEYAYALHEEHYSNKDITDQLNLLNLGPELTPEKTRDALKNYIKKNNI